MACPPPRKKGAKFFRGGGMLPPAPPPDSGGQKNPGGGHPKMLKNGCFGGVLGSFFSAFFCKRKNAVFALDSGQKTAAKNLSKFSKVSKNAFFSVFLARRRRNFFKNAFFWVSPEKILKSGGGASKNPGGGGGGGKHPGGGGGGQSHPGPPPPAPLPVLIAQQNTPCPLKNRSQMRLA